jgi:hypothetical protein
MAVASQGAALISPTRLEASPLLRVPLALTVPTRNIHMTLDPAIAPTLRYTRRRHSKFHLGLLRRLVRLGQMRFMAHKSLFCFAIPF